MNAEPNSPTTPPAIAPRRPLTLRATAFALLLAMLWGGNPVAIKAGLADAGPLRLGALRMALGGIVVLLFALAVGVSLRPKRSELLPLAGLAVLFTVQTALMYFGGDRTSAGHAAVLIATFPLWAALCAHFVVPGDRIAPARAVGVLIAYAGVVVVFSGDLRGGEGLAGDLMMLASALLLGLRQIYLSQTSQAIPVSRLLMTQALAAVIVFLPLSFLLESAPWSWSAAFLAALLYQGIGIAGFGFLGNTWLLQHFLPSRVTATQLTTPVFGVILSWLILGEPIGPELAAGVALLTLGSALAQRRPAPTPNP